MRRTLLKSKIHRATVTAADLHYEGSLTVDADLMAAADLLPHERVEVYNVTGGGRLATYVIPGARGGGTVCANGAAAHLVRAGDLVIIASYGEYDEAECLGHEPVVVMVDGRNRVRAAVGAAA